MAEYRTCEQYVLSLLEENENEVVRLQEVIRDLNRKIGELNERYEEAHKFSKELSEIIKSIAVVNKYEDREWSISFKPLYENSEGSGYSLITDIISKG